MKRLGDFLHGLGGKPAELVLHFPQDGNKRRKPGFVVISYFFYFISEFLGKRHSEPPCRLKPEVKN